jgi:hypothetical protein
MGTQTAELGVIQVIRDGVDVGPDGRGGDVGGLGELYLVQVEPRFVVLGIVDGGSRDADGFSALAHPAGLEVLDEVRGVPLDAGCDIYG